MRIEKLSVGYGSNLVLKNVNAVFEPGKLHVLIGQNGCGKSTLLKTCLGVLESVQGSIELEGQDIQQMSPVLKAQKIAHVLQKRSIPDMKVMQLVLHGRFSHMGWPRRYGKEEKEAAQKALKQLKIADLAGRSLKELSGGQQQKAYLALALCQNTDWILMDEPSAFLDPASSIELMETSRKLVSEGKTVLMVLHDLPSALEYGDLISVMDQGSVIFQGTPDQLLKSGLLERVFKVKAVPALAEGKTKYVLLKES